MVRAISFLMRIKHTEHPKRMGRGHRRINLRLVRVRPAERSRDQIKLQSVPSIVRERNEKGDTTGWECLAQRVEYQNHGNAY